MLEKKAAQIRLDAIGAMYKAGLACTGSSMSTVEILVALYYGSVREGRSALRFNALKPGSEEQDYLVLSKKAAICAQYAILADLDFFDKSELDYVGREGALLKAYPAAKVPGVSATVLSDGEGLSIALGTALALKMDRQANKVFTVLGDYELQKGQIWEAAQVAAYHKLDNLITFIDHAKIEVDTFAPAGMKVEQVQDKFEAFGWNVIQVCDGHNFNEILNALSRAFTSNRKPVCIWCHTVAGKGIEFAERKSGYLNAPLSESEFFEISSKLQFLT